LSWWNLTVFSFLDTDFADFAVKRNSIKEKFGGYFVISRDKGFFGQEIA